MSNVTFTVGTNRNCRFTSAQLTKVNQAIEIFQKVWNSKNFKSAVCDHSWSAENGTTYNRFHMSNGMSNDQVWSCIWNACNEPNATSTNNNTITVMPCASWSDYNWCVNNGTPSVCVNVNYVNCDWYTPVHIASAMMYDFCVNCCGFNGTTIANMAQCWNNTVPAACCTIVRDCAVEVCSDLVGSWPTVTNTAVWNCFPCAGTWTVNTYGTNWVNSSVKVNEAICAMQYEIDCLNSVSNKSSEEMNRYTMLVNAVETMNAMCNNMCTTSLDGCESAWMPATTATGATVG